MNVASPAAPRNMSSNGSVQALPNDTAARCATVRSFTERLCNDLASEDYVVQSMGDASSTKWPPVHTSWFFETCLFVPSRAGHEHEPIACVSCFEADALARWAGARLPTEQECELAAGSTTVDGNFAESGVRHPATARLACERPRQLWHDQWEWTGSRYSPYPGCRNVFSPDATLQISGFRQAKDGA